VPTLSERSGDTGVSAFVDQKLHRVEAVASAATRSDR
jgi:hypothetical protein